MDIKPRPPRRNTNIDGFIRPPTKPNRALYSSYAANRPARPLRPRPMAAVAPQRPVPSPAPREVAPEPTIQPEAAEELQYFAVPDAAPLKGKAEFKPRARAKSPKRWKKRVVRMSLVVFALLLIVGGWLGTRLIGNVDKVFHGNIVSDVQALSSNTVLKGQTNGRINILLAGDSADDPGHQGAQLTDSIMLISLDLKDHTGFMLSIPRDTWVYVPGVGQEKINAANDQAKFSESGFPNGGMGQLEEVLTNEMGIPIDYYGLIDYTAFRDAVNAVGGITVDIQSPDPRGLYDAYTNLRLPNGEDTLTGVEALNLARARGDGTAGDISYGFPDSDYTRTMHQRQMLVALQQKATTLGVLANPLKIGQLMNAVGNNIQTDLSLADVLQLVKLTKGISINNLQSLTLSNSGTNALLTNYDAPDGEDALAPAAGLDNFSAIQAYYQAISSGQAVPGVVSESPTVEILNASNVDGLAKQEALDLEAKGYNVTGVADTSDQYQTSEIIDESNGKMPNSAAELKQIFNSDTTYTTNPSSSPEAEQANAYSTNFVVVLGDNWNGTTITNGFNGATSSSSDEGSYLSGSSLTGSQIN